MPPSAVCPLPTAHSYDDVKSAYDAAKKKMPGLTPAAWRKQAAIDLGIDYNTFLAIWKAGKGKGKVVPASTPTVPAAASQTVSMGIKANPAAVMPKVPDVKKAITSHTDAKGVFVYKSPQTGSDDILVQLKWGSDAAKKAAANVNLTRVFNDIKGAGYHIEVIDKNTLSVKMIPKLPSGPATAKAAMAAPKTSTYFKPFKNNKGAQEAISEVAQKYKNGLMTKTEYGQALDDIARTAESLGFANWQTAKGLVEGMKINAGIFKKAAAVSKKTVSAAKVADTTAPVPGLIQTAHGPLDNALAKAAYAKMKKDMPGATPAQLRHAAAEYLGVDYNDYLQAWKLKPGKAAPAPKLPSTPTTQPHISPSPAGKYKDKDVGADELKADLAQLYGPGANKSYINISYDDTTGAWSTILPKSLLPTPASQKAVTEGLENLGLIVNKTGQKITISTAKSAQTAAKNASQIKATGTYTLPDGRVVLDLGWAEKWSNSWWAKQSAATRDAWRKYTASYYREINGYLRKGTVGGYPHSTSSAQIREWSKLLSNSMSTVGNEFTVFRGTNINIDQFRVGGKWSDDAFMSTSITPGGAWSGVKFEIVMAKGSRGMYIDPHSSNRGEREFLIDKGTSFRIIEVDQRNKRVKMVAIPKRG